MEWDAPEQEEMQQTGGNFLAQPGIYHAVITASYENLAPPKKDGSQTPINGFSVSLDVLDGTVQGQEGRSVNVTFFDGKLSAKDQGKFARKKQAAFLIAANVITPEQLGKRVSIDLQKSAGQQIIIKLEKDEDNSTSDTTYLRLAGADVWHVDDPRAEAYPKKAEAIGLIPQELRRKPEFFASLLPAKGGSTATSGNGGHSGGTASATATAPAKTRPAVDLDDL